jgi:protease-4
MVESVLKQIIAATNDPKVKGILLEVNSPGGAVTPSDEIYRMLKRFKTRPDRHVVIFIQDLGASGAYYISMAGDYIVAEPTAIVGSVGVIMQAMNLKGLGDKLGIQSVTIASGKNKDILNPLKMVNPEHVALLQNLIDEMQDRFASIVMNARGFKNRDLLDGRVFMAPQAKENHFIDQVGYWSDSVDVLKRILKVNEVYMIRYERKRGSFLEEVFSAKGPQVPDLHILQSSPTFLYQWNP